MLEEIDWLRVSFYISLYLLAVLYIAIFLAIVGHILMPKKLLQKYFKEPYFLRWELNKFSVFPFFIFRTVMFMRILAQPSSGKKRGMTEAYKMVQPWFRWYCGFVMIFTFSAGIPFVLITLSYAIFL